jgi:hypothetical protein
MDPDCALAVMASLSTITLFLSLMAIILTRHIIPPFIRLRIA